jgi:hypothetical protein
LGYFRNTVNISKKSCQAKKCRGGAVELFEKLAVAQAQAAAGKKGLTHTQVMKKLRQRLHGK